MTKLRIRNYELSRTYTKCLDMYVTAMYPFVGADLRVCPCWAERRRLSQRYAQAHTWVRPYEFLRILLAFCVSPTLNNADE